MKIAFFGSANIGFTCLSKLIQDKFDIVLVVSQAAKKSGRHLLLKSSPIEKLAFESSVKFYCPENVNSVDSVNLIKESLPDVFVVVSYGQIFSTELLSIPSKLAINLHTSLLPKYRGAAPINWAIINGDKETGITIMKMSKEMDAGPIIAQKKIIIEPFDNALVLTDRLVNLGTELLVQTLLKIEKNDFKLMEQDEKQVTFARKLVKEDGLIVWGQSACIIDNKIRGCYGWPGSFTLYRGKILKIFSTGIEPVNNTQPGKIIRVAKDGILVQCGQNALLVKELQLESGKRLTAEQFVAGHKITPFEKLG